MNSSFRTGLPLLALAFAVVAAAPARSSAQVPEAPAAAVPPDTTTTPASGLASPAPEAAPSPQLADAQDRLATALKSYTMVSDENAQLKAEASKSSATIASLNQELETARSSIASLQARAAAATQVEPLRTALRQAQDEAGALAAENAQIRTQLALAGPAPGGGLSPTRPGAPTGMAVEAPPTAAMSATPAQVAKSTAAAIPAAPRTYKVAEGDTLSKIALKFYGSGASWKKILDANRDVVKDERNLYVGVTLKIP